MSPPKRKAEATVRSILEGARRGGHRNLDLMESRQVFRRFGIPMNRAYLARTPEEAKTLSRRFDGLVVIKIISPQVVHKTDVGGVRVGVAPGLVEKETRLMFDRVRRRLPRAELRGVLVEEQVRGIELIVGMARDPQFGPLIMFGVGGVFVEVYRDTVFRLAPLDRRTARAMLEEIRGRDLLEGARGFPRVDKSALARFLQRVSRIPLLAPEIAEMDLNPVVMTSRGPLAVDARVVLESPGRR